MVKVLTPGDSRLLSLPGRRSREILAAATGAVCSTLRYVEIDPQQPGAPRRGPHVHSGFEECIYVMSGSGTMQAESGEHPVNAGDTVLVPAGERHVTHNTGNEVLTLLCFFPTGDVGAGTTEFESWELSGKQSGEKPE
ncbi:MAG TPA: cupin domain-containing protein [Afifellaceae bacterium]|nr:cupin domain-containing protein [Afifellaceae bacterium]